MKKMRKMKERIFCVVLTLVMVVALFAGMAPMDVHAAATQEPTEEELNCILTTVDVTLEVGEQYIQCSQLPEVTSENYKWAYFYYPAPSDMEGYEEGVLGLIASVQETIGVESMSNSKAAHREEYGLLVNEIPSNGQIPVSGDGYGLLYIVQIYDYPIDVSDSGYRYYYNKVAMFDVSKGGTVSNDLVGEETTPISITQQPESVTVNIGAKVTFSVTATGDNLTYKWQVAYGEDKNFGDAYGSSGSDTATFTTYGTDKDFNGYRYRCIITDENGNSVTSDVATLTLIGAEPPTEIPGVSIAKTADGYKVTGLGAVEEGYRWGYYPYTLREGEDLDGAVTAKLNEHLTDGPWQNEIANSFDESYEITTYTFPGRAPESIDNYDYIEIVKLNENGFPSEVAVLPLPKDAAPEVTYDITLDRTNYADGYVELYTYNSEGTNVAVTQENNATIAMPEGGKVRVFADSAFTVTAEGATISEMLSGGEEGYYYELTGIAADTTVVVNKVTTQEQTYELTIDCAGFTEDAPLAVIRFDSDGYDIDAIEVANGDKVEIPVGGSVIVASATPNFKVAVENNLADVSDLQQGAAECGYVITNIQGDITIVIESITQGGDPTYNITLDRTNYADGYVDLYTYDSEGSYVANTQDNNATISMPEGGKVKVFADSEFTVTAEGATISEMLSGGEEGYYYELTNITQDTTIVVNPENDENFIDTVDVNFDWQEVPLLVKGSRELPSFSEVTATVTVDGAELDGIMWGIKVTDSLKVTEEDDYYNEALATVGAENINAYNSQISHFGEVYGWAPLEMVLSNPYYKINENDVYAAYVAIEAEDGKYFGTSSGDEYLGNLTCNVEVGYKVIDGNGKALVVFFELGTLAEMEQEKNPTVHTHSLTEVPAKAATCTAVGNKAYYTCSGCDSLFADANGTTTTTAEAVKIAALGHDWTGEWTITKEATATEEGKKETLCERDCGQKKVVIIPTTGTTDDNGNLEKDAEVEPEASIEEATLNNSKEELLGAGNIFDDAEKAQIENGTDARVWLEVTKTDESAIAPTDKTKIEQAATQIMGDNLVITYFDADLFKQVGTQVGTNEKTPVPEPGVDIKITITIPDELLNSDGTISREYQIIRLHEGEVIVINGTFDSATGEFTFVSDKFSTYAIVYKDVPVNDNPNPNPTPVPGGETPTPAPGGETPTPAPGGENPTPAPGGDENPTPAPGGDENPTPAPGGGENTTPAPSNNDVVNSGENKLDEVPKTGESNVTLYFFILMLLSGAGVVICSRIKKTSNKES